MIRSAFISCLALALGGCLTIPEGVFSCFDANDCPEGFDCVSGYCYEAGGGDGGVVGIPWECPDGSGEVLLCDGRIECENGADEGRCGQRQCDDGSATLRLAQFCDNVPDCDDGSDEVACAPCRDTELESTDVRIPRAWLCDGNVDCPSFVFDPGRFVDEDQCLPCDGEGVVHSFFNCDGTPDCGDGSDEAECFYCVEQDGVASEPISRWLLCDGNDDCPAGQDEDFCGGGFVCVDGLATIAKNYLCDGFVDCADASDEDSGTCSVAGIDGRTPGVVWPATLECSGFTGDLPTWAFCQGVTQCDDASDEVRANCPFLCLDGTRIPREFLCDANADCPNAEDEGLVRGTDPCAGP